jgi:hypothetical protein
MITEQMLKESRVYSMHQEKKKYMQRQNNNVVQKQILEDDVKKRLSCYFVNVIKMPSRIGCNAQQPASVRAARRKKFFSFLSFF